ncbi:MAG TPA: hypothetical protein VFA97_05275 [Gaiellaceae bacterium]|nr:hypothetical protein [Gaiellaceae bacterium]
MTGRSLAHKLLRQYVGRTLCAVAALTVAVYFLGVPALTILFAVATGLVGLWWLYYLLHGPPRRGSA